jgi:hypothetical protein
MLRPTHTRQQLPLVPCVAGFLWLQAVLDVDDTALKMYAAAAFAAFPQLIPGVQLADTGRLVSSGVCW